MSATGLNVEEMAARSGYSEKTINEALVIADMSDLERETVRNNEISDSIVVEIAKIEDAKTRTALISECIRKRLKLSEIRALCEKERLGGKVVSKSSAQRTIKYKDLRLFDNTLSRALSLLNTAGIESEVKTEKVDNGTEYKIKITY